MTTDRFTTSLLALIGAALTLIALNPWLATLRWPDVVRPAPAEAQAVRTISVPRDWGKAVGFIPGYAWLEAADGTIRLVSIGTTEPVGGAVLVITRR